MVLLSVLSNILASLEPFTKVCIIYMCYFNSQEKITDSHFWYFRVFKEYPCLTHVSPTHVSLFQFWDFCWYSLNILKYPKMGIRYFFPCNSLFETLFTFFMGYAKKRQIIRRAFLEFKYCHTIFLYSTMPQCLTFSLSKLAEFKNLPNFLNFIL